MFAQLRLLSRLCVSEDESRLVARAALTIYRELLGTAKHIEVRADHSDKEWEHIVSFREIASEVASKVTTISLCPLFESTTYLSVDKSCNISLGAIEWPYSHVTT